MNCEIRTLNHALEPIFGSNSEANTLYSMHRERVYDPTINRFLQPDSIAPERVNIHSFLSAPSNSSYFIPLAVSFAEFPNRVGTINRSSIDFYTIQTSETNRSKRRDLYIDLNRRRNPVTFNVEG